MTERCNAFMESINEKIGNHRQPAYNERNPGNIYNIALDIGVNDDGYNLPYEEELVDMETGEIDEVYNESLDEYIRAEVIIPGKDGVAVLQKVRKCKRDHNNDPIGKKNTNPILDSRIYDGVPRWTS